MLQRFALSFLLYVAAVSTLNAQNTAGGGTTDSALLGAKTVATGSAVLPAGDPSLPESSEKVIRDLGKFVQDIEGAQDERRFARFSLLIRIGIAVVIVVLQVLLIRFLKFLFKHLRLKLDGFVENRFRPLKVKSYVLIDKPRMAAITQFLVTVLWYVALVFQLFITLPLVFSLFGPTRNLASTLLGYIFNPLISIFWGFVRYIPNIFTIAIIIIVARYILRALKFFSDQISRKKLVLNGFYSDWAVPTYNILRVLVIAFTVAMVYPYLPNSDSQIFQGVSVLVGVIFSLSSGSLIGNLIAGLVMTYMRPFKIGDRIKLGDITGFVVERSAMVTRLRTHKNEFVSFPNQQILQAVITNYSRSAAEGQGLVLHADITFGYDVPWLTVHEVLIKAAENIEFVEKNPKPYVLQTKLDDFYCHYDINFYTRNVEKIPAIYSKLYQNIQDGFNEKGISCTAPHFMNVTEEHAE